MPYHLIGVSKIRETVNHPALTVFVCSTFSDLSEERDSVLDAIRRHQLKHDAMEFFGARSNRPIETCLEEVRSSHILVVIVGGLYGTLVPGLGVSFSEAEYNEGHKLKKTCLVYMRDENVPILPKYVEQESDKIELLNQWKATLEDRHTVVKFEDSSDLALQVAVDLAPYTRMVEDIDWAGKEAWKASSAPLMNIITQLFGVAIKGGATDQALLSSTRRYVSEVMNIQVRPLR